MSTDKIYSAFIDSILQKQDQNALKVVIIDQLAQVEKLRRVNVLFAVESGSRAWGFASQNSDFDVRFVYLNRLDEYLRVRPVRDVIENDDVKQLGIASTGLDLDFSGFDLRKFFDLMLKSNPSVFEWLASPIVYYETKVNRYWEAVREAAKTCFLPKAALHHYVSMAKHNYREHMRDGASATVKLKKYLYITRPLLCGQFILENGIPAPMPFDDVVDMAARGPNASQAVKAALRDLVRRKQSGDELMEGPIVPEINAWIEAEIPRLKLEADRAPEGKPNFEDLDTLFSCAVRLMQDGGIGCDISGKFHEALDRGATEEEAAKAAAIIRQL